MQNTRNVSLLFPIALVLFEFAVYIANDMIQPNMLAVVREFGVGISWVPTSLAAFTLGGVLLPWLMGPLSDHIGRRPVMLGGVVLFILACLATLWVHDIHSFMLLRVVQGMGLCFVAAIGYASVQEAFEEKRAVRLTALMSNVALLAPLIGPLLGSVLAHYWPWRACFWLIGGIALIALVGLYNNMPETVDSERPLLKLGQIASNYRRLLTDRAFLRATACLPLLGLPLLGWVSLSPVMLVADAKMSVLAYGLWQLPVIGAMIIGSLALAHFTPRWPLGHSIRLANWPLATGILIMLLGSLFNLAPLYSLILGLTLITFAEGLSVSVIYRFALTTSSVSTGTVAASLTMLALLIYTVGIELMKIAYLKAGLLGFALLCLLSLLMYALLARGTVRTAMQAREEPSLSVTGSSAN